MLQLTCVSGAFISDALYLSPGRSDYLIPLMVLRVRHIVSEDSRNCFESFLLIARTSRIVTAAYFAASTGGCTGCSSI